MAKMLPASRTPRRLAMVMTATTTTAMSTCQGPRLGMAATICSEAEEMDTATVST